MFKRFDRLFKKYTQIFVYGVAVIDANEWQ